MKAQPIGLETQIEDVLIGETKQQTEDTAQKIKLVTKNVNNIIKINNCNVYNVIVKGEYLYYNLSKRFKGEQKYYYPIKFATIEFK
jgi:hypothetical protein